jgi:DNA-directed RNA polymerase subunit beta
MASIVQTNFRVRKNLGRVRRIVDIPNLIDIQKSSYDKFLQMSVPASQRHEVGLQAVFRSVFPIKDFNGTSELVFVSYNLEAPKYDVEECRQRGMTFSAPIKVDDPADDLRHARWRRAHRARHQGAGGLLRRDPADDRHRHVHHQRHRARRRQPAAPQPRRLLRPRQGQDPLERQAPLQRPRDPIPRLVARLRVRPEGHHLLPHRSSPQDARDGPPARARLHDAGPAELLLQHRDVFLEKGGKYAKNVEFDLLPGQRATRDIKVGSDVIVKRNTKFTRAAVRKLKEAKLDRLPIELDELVSKVAAHDIIDPETGEVLRRVQRGAHRAQAREAPRGEHRELQGALHRRPQRRQLPAQHAARDKVKTTEDAILEIYSGLRPGDPPTLETARTLFRTCSSTPSATTCRRSAASSSTTSSTATSPRKSVRRSTSPRSSPRRTSSRPSAT